MIEKWQPTMNLRIVLRGEWLSDEEYRINETLEQLWIKSGDYDMEIDWRPVERIESSKAY